MAEAIAEHPAFVPPQAVIERANVTVVARQLGLPGYPALHRWSVQNRVAYWELVVNRLDVKMREKYTEMLDASRPTQPRWLVGARLNIVESCLQADGAATAIIESDGTGGLLKTTYAQLRDHVMQIAGALLRSGITLGDGVAIVMPMHARAVAAYLAVIACGANVIGVADSFAAEEIATRLRIGKAKLVLTQDVIAWGTKQLPLHEKVVAAGAGPMVVARTVTDHNLKLRNHDRDWDDFLSGAQPLTEPVECAPSDAINILFSSGTTGEPKAIPWDHTTAIKCAADAHFHQDVHSDDIVCWPTSLGWMMGPWLIFASLMNRAAMALYGQSPGEPSFGKFVQNAGVTKLGLVPSMVRAWRQSNCMTGADWSKIKAFSSSGECSNADEMAWLMQLAGGKPIIEYCGGTEIGGAYITSTVVQKNIPATFTTPALGLDIMLLDEAGIPSDRGEVFIVGPSMGLSTRLLNRDHEATYFTGTPTINGLGPLRRHGDELEKLSNTYYRATGRCDDTMNLGGIKVGCTEIERALIGIESVHETAAVAISPTGGGPSRLVIFAVPKPATAIDATALKPAMQKAIREHLNPLFRVEDVIIVNKLPRTASNKVMRRELRDQYK